MERRVGKGKSRQAVSSSQEGTPAVVPEEPPVVEEGPPVNEGSAAPPALSGPAGALSGVQPQPLPPEIIEENERLAAVRQGVAQQMTDDGLVIEELSTSEPLYGVGHDPFSGERFRYEVSADGEITKAPIE